MLIHCLVMGFGIDLGALLALFSTFEVGNPLSVTPGYSIGGVSAKVSPILGGLGGLFGNYSQTTSSNLLSFIYSDTSVATPRGIDATHNLIEADGSSTRDDVYVTGDAWTMNMTKFLEVYNAIPVNGAMTMDDVYARSAKRFDEGIATNPYFYYGPYSGTFARHGGYMFNIRLLSNHSAEHPRGGNMSKQSIFESCVTFCLREF
jgi:hypothetical protein